MNKRGFVYLFFIFAVLQATVAQESPPIQVNIDLDGTPYQGQAEPIEPAKPTIEPLSTQDKPRQIPSDLVEANQMLEIVNERLRREIDHLAQEQRLSAEYSWWRAILTGGGIALVFLAIGFVIGRRIRSGRPLL